MRPNEPCPGCRIPPSAERETVNRSRAATTALLIAGMVLFVLAASERPFAYWEPVHLLALSMCVLGTWFLVRPTACKIALWDEGFAVIGRQEKPEPYRWADLSAVRWDDDRSGIVCSDSNGHVAARLDTTFFGTKSRADRFRRQASALISRREADAAESP